MRDESAGLLSRLGTLEGLVTHAHQNVVEGATSSAVDAIMVVREFAGIAKGRLFTGSSRSLVRDSMCADRGGAPEAKRRDEEQEAMSAFHACILVRKRGARRCGICTCALLWGHTLCEICTEELQDSPRRARRVPKAAALDESRFLPSFLPSVRRRRRSASAHRQELLGGSLRCSVEGMCDGEERTSSTNAKAICRALRRQRRKGRALESKDGSSNSPLYFTPVVGGHGLRDFL